MAFTCLAILLTYFQWEDAMQKARLSAGENWKRLCWPSFKLLGGKQGKQFSCVFSLGGYVSTRLSKKVCSLFFRTHFT